MPDSRVYIASTVAVGLVAMAHAALTWPPRATVALFAGGATVAFVAEAVAIRPGLARTPRRLEGCVTVTESSIYK